MNEFAKFLKVLAAVVAVFALGGAIGWYGTRGKPVPYSPQPPIQAPVPAVDTPAPTSPPGKPAFMANNYRPLNSDPVQRQVTGTVATVNLITNWEDRLDEILSGKEDEDEKAKSMLKMFPRLPPDGQEEVAQHLSNLVSDEQYPALGQYLTNSSLPEPVLDVLLSDALNRPNKLKLPILVGVARDPANPKAAEAKDLLELYLEEDYGTDWNTWQQKVDEWLAENPD
jgi:hypothetical protein